MFTWPRDRFEFIVWFRRVQVQDEMFGFDWFPACLLDVTLLSVSTTSIMDAMGYRGQRHAGLSFVTN